MTDRLRFLPVACRPFVIWTSQAMPEPKAPCPEVKEVITATVLVDGRPVVFPLSRDQFLRIKEAVERMRMPWWRRWFLRVREFFHV